MFYEKYLGEELRFGDVVTGYLRTIPKIDSPIFSKEDLSNGFKVDFEFPFFLVVMTPCCSIGENKISLTPLIKVRFLFFDNPYFASDLTRINRKMEPKHSVTPKEWEKYDEHEKQKRILEGKNYALLSLFIYDKSDIFPKYRLSYKNREILETNYYMIDFNNIFCVNCKKINSSKSYPKEIKILQLSVETRAELRDKLAYFYSRIPEEDRILMDT